MRVCLCRWTWLIRRAINHMMLAVFPGARQRVYISHTLAFPLPVVSFNISELQQDCGEFCNILPNSSDGSKTRKVVKHLENVWKSFNNRWLTYHPIPPNEHVLNSIMSSTNQCIIYAVSHPTFVHDSTYISVIMAFVILKKLAAHWYNCWKSNLCEATKWRK